MTKTSIYSGLHLLPTIQVEGFCCKLKKKKSQEDDPNMIILECMVGIGSGCPQKVPCFITQCSSQSFIFIILLVHFKASVSGLEIDDRVSSMVGRLALVWLSTF